MLRAVGFKRLFMLSVLVIFLVVGFIFVTYSMKPNIKNTEAELLRNQGDIAEMTDNMDKLVQGIEQFATQKDNFETIQGLGFFDSQNRVEARKRLNLMQQESRLLAARYTIKPAITENNDKAAEAGYKIIKTEIEFGLDAIEDSDIYNFIYLLNHGFPGHISITDLDLSRAKEVTQPLLRKIGDGQPEPIIKAVLKVNWRTMIPDSTISVSSEEGGQ